MGNLFSNEDEYPGSEFDQKRRLELASSLIHPEHLKLLNIPLIDWRKNETNEKLQEFRKVYHLQTNDMVVSIDGIPKWLDSGWVRPNYGPTIDYKLPVLWQPNDKLSSDSSKEIPPENIEEKQVTPLGKKGYLVEEIPILTPNDELNAKVSLYKGDITKLEIDAIQNAANNTCLGGGGIDGAIHSAAGQCLLRECALLGGCRTGHTRITKGYDLPAKFILHTVGPMKEDPVALENCYLSSLKVALKYNLKTIVFIQSLSIIFSYVKLILFYFISS